MYCMYSIWIQYSVLLTRTLEQGPGPGLGCQGPGQGEGLESEGKAPRQ